MNGKKQPEWGYRPDGQPRRFGDLTPEEQQQVIGGACATLKAEIEDPAHPTHRTIKALLVGPDVPRTRQ